ncbi:hypothetical protein [Vreelandella aquamarina]|uniref:hypothetical protein n=1 Tax=Vreelandella aquamarina TaxID=77097 RepID=UPI000781085B|nr:hypothetical protein [Halomonas axialensis]
MAKLTEQQWQKARDTWEADSRDGYAWLIRELELDVSGPAVRKRALKDEWSKGGGKPKAKPARKPKTAQKPKTENRKPRRKPEAPVEELEELPPGLEDKAVPLDEADSIPFDEAGEEVGGASHHATLTRVRTRSLEDDLGESPLAEVYDAPRGGSKYHPAFAELAYKHCLLGATPKHVADLLKVDEVTVYRWMDTHAEFAAAMEQGRVDADANVARSLYKKATGYTHQAVKVFQYQGAPVVVPYTEIVAPDTEAAKFWLKNRQPELWKEKVEIEEQPTLALVDKEALGRVYREALEHAAEVERQMQGRAERLGLTIDHDDIGIGAGGGAGGDDA